ncbi:MAG: ribosome biogenesis GTP-binding protein YihA/YsxC [Desulfobulbaceae bacterium]|nr:ribosome biogenesis GTP-binding protein YihA/YsxC [Desulfobulbaceae bacterium]
MNYNTVEFVTSVYSLKQLPESELPEIAFAGRSNVGKSSLINKLVNRRNLVKTSSKPGKTQSINLFQVGESFTLVDLPGYGFARVGKDMQNSWQKLITGYLEKRENLICVVVIIDIRHELKAYDRDLIDWLRQQGRTFLPVYTKADKLSGNKLTKQAAMLDAALSLRPAERIIFSSKTGKGCDILKSVLASQIESC